MRKRFGVGFRDTFGSLAIRNFRLFFMGQFVSQVGNWLTMVASSLYILDRTDSGVAVGLLVACQFAPVLLIGPWAGLVADRSDKRKLLLIVQTVAMVQSFALAAMVFSHEPIPAFYAVALLGGFAVAFDNPARRSFVVEMVPLDRVQNAVSLNSALMTSSPPATAGASPSTASPTWPCWWGSGSSTRPRSGRRRRRCAARARSGPGSATSAPCRCCGCRSR
jgi:MFS family permease